MLTLYVSGAKIEDVKAMKKELVKATKGAEYVEFFDCQDVRNRFQINIGKPQKTGNKVYNIQLSAFKPE